MSTKKKSVSKRKQGKKNRAAGTRFEAKVRSEMEKISISVFIDRENKNKTIELEKDSSLENLLEKLGINPVTVIVSRNNNLIQEDEKLRDKDELKILSVISGG